MWKRLRPPGRAAARYFAPRATWRTLFRARRGKAEPACKPGSVEDSHSSRRRVTTPLQRSTRTHRGQRHCVPIRPCSGWGLPCPVALAPRAVRSYRTVSPLPRIPRHLKRQQDRSAVCSLLHWPSAHAAQVLPGILPCGARTFLPGASTAATVRPTPRSHSTASPSNTPRLAS